MKKELRKQVLKARDSLSPEERSKKSEKVKHRLFSLPEFRAARTVMFFASFRSEVETGPMIRQALAAGKKVVLPKVKGGELGLFEIRDFDKDVSPGTWGIPEPHESVPAVLDEIDLIVTPGAAFDENGNRLGYGAGFYDKLLVNYTGLSVALAFEEQILLLVPASVHDIPIKKIVTEKRVITVQRA